MNTHHSTLLTPHSISLIAFDADDTLWDCQGFFDKVEEAYCQVLAPYASTSEVSESLFKTETANMPLMGYGCKAFTISLVENAVKVSQGKVTGDEVEKVVKLGKSLLELPATPLPGVETTLRTIHQSGRYHMVVFTKGELLDQQNKLIRSGLSPYFDDIIVVSDKTKAEYTKMCTLFDTTIDHLLMVGNSFKSDIEPVLLLGGHAAHIPFGTMWRHEQTKEYDHPRLIHLNKINDLLDTLNIEH